ncbi:MAG: ATP-binding protein [Deltaproteobacteria bacterium]|nr:ATP-binding protein [Deltaproteobacteria bacterium]
MLTARTTAIISTSIAGCPPRRNARIGIATKASHTPIHTGPIYITATIILTFESSAAIKCILLHANRCSAEEIRRYRGRISGPLLDRIDLHVEMSAVPWKELTADRAGELSEVVQVRIEAARETQRARFAGRAFAFNAAMTTREVKRHCHPQPDAMVLLERAVA